MSNGIASFYFIVIALMSGGTIGGLFGFGFGADNERARQNAQSVIDLTKIITASNQLINDSNAASKSMRQALTKRAAHDTHTTREIKNALAQNAGNRVDCRFDDGVMRNLNAARSRAAATAASGVRNAVPSSGAVSR
ncbi:hypothetical protein [Glaciimonas immobilis]|uniref:Uncharacterized protein n=1 Tax=Glaciimonas immobilis TaxID=728004 RepID=A0A840RNF5_9BURK|nr:hypothetical protein [Glaciimonas immobilis]KAF3999049.1 hypothetical protein HAV38_03645 [Glaciimonas immobilis]MBB5198478.1 hypothetical protein [Glaciimonas immobilis]